MLDKINYEKMKYNYLVNILDVDILSSISDLIFTTPTENPFTTLKNKLLKIFENSITQITKTLLQELALLDQNPSVLLRKLKDFASEQVTDDILKNLWLQRLPSNIETVLAVSSDELD